MDISEPQKPNELKNDLGGLDLLGNNSSSNAVSNPQYPPPVILGDIFNLNSGIYQSQSQNNPYK